MSRLKTSSPRCATPAIDKLRADWKQEPSPYDDPAYQVPTCQREKIIPESLKKQIRCATPFMDELIKLDAEYDQRIAAGESETEIVLYRQNRRVTTPKKLRSGSS